MHNVTPGLSSPGGKDEPRRCIRKNADDCRQQAERCRDPLDKERWLKIAEDWMKMVQEANDGPRESDRSARLQVMLSAEEASTSSDSGTVYPTEQRPSTNSCGAAAGRTPATMPALASDAGVRFRKHPVAQDRGTTSAAAGKLDDSHRDDLPSADVAIDVQGVAGVLIRQGHRLNIVGLECAG
jgi:hypothetical protein